MSDEGTLKRPRTKEEVIKELERLSQEPGFLYSLSFILLKDLFYSAEQAADINWHERVSFQEVAFITGLMIKAEVNPNALPLPEESENQIKKVYELLQELHTTYMHSFFTSLPVEKGEAVRQKTSKEQDEEVREFMGNGERVIEPIFYGGSGAYDFQYLEFAPKKYEKDTEWIVGNRGFSMETAAKLATTIRDNQVKKFNETGKKFRTAEKGKRLSFAELSKNTLEIFIFSPSEIKGFSEEEIENFLESFALVPNQVNQKFNDTGDYNALDSHPIVKISEDCYFLPVHFLLTQSMYESPFYWMHADKQYRQTAAKNRGESTEEMVFEMLSRIFPKGSVFKNAEICGTKGKRVTDIDVLAVSGNKAVIIQAKSKKLTELSKKGDTESLKKDFEEAVQSAYEQGLVCRKAIVDKSNKLVDSAGNVIVLDESIDDAYIICLSSDHYPAVTPQLNYYLKKDSSDPYPLAFSIFDLELLVFYLNNPFEFLYYLRQRVALSEKIFAASEISLLAFLIKVGLKSVEENGLIGVYEQMAQLIDANFPQVTGRHPNTDASKRLYKEWGNEKFRELIEQIKEAREPQFMDVAFILYDLSDEAVDNLMKAIEGLKQKTVLRKKGFALSMEINSPGKKRGLTFLTVYGEVRDFSEHLLTHAMLRKYRGRGDEWIAFGWEVGSPLLIDAMAFTKEPWTEDTTLEEACQKIIPNGTLTKPDGTRIGRNEKCLCGSGLKYKKCHGKASVLTPLS